MYDLEWARRLYGNYRKSCPRAEQIDRCLQQLAAESGFHFSLTTGKIREALVRAIRDKHYAKIWYQYKALCKRSPFDSALAVQVARSISYLYMIQRADAQQILLEWSQDEVHLFEEST